MSEHKIESAPTAATVIPAAVRESGADVAAEEELLATTDWPGGLFAQRKLQLGSVDDPLEGEADRVADHVMRMPAGPVAQRVCEDCEDEPETVSRKASYAVMRKCSACEEEARTADRPDVSFIQRQANGDSGSLSDGAADRISSTRGSGASMPSETQAFMEQRFGADFSGVSIHAGASDADLSSELNAHAFTVGKDIYFNEGKYAPSTSEGQHLLAHELAHVLQQRGPEQHRIQRQPAVTGEKVSVVRVVAFEGSAEGEAYLSNDRVEPVAITLNELAEGEYTFELDEQREHHYRGPGPFLFRKKPAYGWAQTVTVKILKGTSAQLRQDFYSLPWYVRHAISAEASGPGSYEGLQQLVDMGNRMVREGMTETEVLLLEQRMRGMRFDKKWDLLDAYLEQRQVDVGLAQDTHTNLLKSMRALATIPDWINVNSLKLLIPGTPEYQRVTKYLLENTSFDGIEELRMTVNAFAEAFDQELYGLANASLNATEAALLALDLTYVGIWQSKMPSPERVRAEVERLRKDPKVISAQEALKEARATGATDWGIQQIQNSLRRTVSESSALKFLPTWDIEDFLFGSDDKLYRQLVDFLRSGREHVRKARESIDDLAFLWSADNIIGMEKALLGIERGSILNLIVDQVAHERRTDTSLWHTLWTVMEFAFMFVPGPIGFALRTAAAIAGASSATASHGKAVSGFETGLMSDKPSSKALTVQLLFTAGGVVLDAALTRPFATAERVPFKIGKAGGEIHPSSVPGLEPPATKPTVATGEAGKAGETAAHEAGALGAPPRSELFRGITDDTVKLLNEHPDIRRVLEAHPNAADLFKKCHSSCFPDFLNARQFEERMTRLELLQEEMDLAGYTLNREAVRDLMHAQTNVQDIDKALKYLEDKFHYQVPSFNVKAAGVAPRPLTGDPRLSPGPGPAPVESGVKGTMGAATHAGELFTELPRRLGLERAAQLRQSIVRGERSLVEVLAELPEQGVAELMFPTGFGRRFIDHVFMEGGTLRVVFRESKNVSLFRLTDEYILQLEKDISFLRDPRFRDVVIEWRISGNIEQDALNRLRSLQREWNGRFRFQLDAPPGAYVSPGYRHVPPNPPVIERR